MDELVVQGEVSSMSLKFCGANLAPQNLLKPERYLMYIFFSHFSYTVIIENMLDKK